MKKLVINIVILLLVGCRSSNIIEINKFYREKYPETNQFNNTKNQEKSRKKIFKKYFNEVQEKLDNTILIEIFKYPNGDFSDLHVDTFFCFKSEIYSSYSASNHYDEAIVNKVDEYYKPTIVLILKLVKAKKFTQLEKLYKKEGYGVSDTGLVYVTTLDEKFHVVDGIKFNEFMVPVKVERPW